MQSQPPGLHVLKRASAQFCAVHIFAAILQHDLERFPIFPAQGSLNAAEVYFDGPVGVACVRVTYDIRQRFVDPQHHGSAFRLGESQPLRKLRHRAAHCAKRLRITAQFHFQQQIAPVQGAFSSGLGYGTRGEIVMRQLCRLFRKIESGRRFPPKNLTLPFKSRSRTVLPSLSVNWQCTSIEVFPVTVVTLRAISLPFLNPRTVLRSTTRSVTPAALWSPSRYTCWNPPCF